MTMFRRFFSNPVVGIVGSLASIIGLLLAVYFYMQSTRERELTYLIHPAKAVVVKSGQTSRLSVTLDGKKLDGDITAAQIAVWNNGNEPIRQQHMLEPLTIHADVPIIDASIRKRSREVTSLSLDTSRMQSGDLKISWQILERNDGGIVQIVFAGGPETPIKARAIVEGQTELEKVEISAEAEDIKYRGNRLFILVFSWMYIGVGVVMLIVGIPRRQRLRERSGGSARGRVLQGTAYVAMPLFMILAGIYAIIFKLPPEPPFSF